MIMLISSKLSALEINVHPVYSLFGLSANVMLDIKDTNFRVGPSIGLFKDLAVATNTAVLGARGEYDFASKTASSFFASAGGLAVVNSSPAEVEGAGMLWALPPRTIAYTGIGYALRGEKFQSKLSV